MGSSDGKPADVRPAARIVGEVLRELRLEPWVMTTGSRRHHVTVPLRRRAEVDMVRVLARGVATLAAAREPPLFAAEPRKARRQRRRRSSRIVRPSGCECLFEQGITAATCW